MGSNNDRLRTRLLAVGVATLFAGASMTMVGCGDEKSDVEDQVNDAANNAADAADNAADNIPANRP